MAENKTPLVAMTLDELKNAAKELGMPAFTGAHMAKWLSGKGVSVSAQPKGLETVIHSVCKGKKED